MHGGFESSQNSPRKSSMISTAGERELGHPIRGVEFWHYSRVNCVPVWLSLKTCKKALSVGLYYEKLKPAADKKKGISVAKLSEAIQLLGCLTRSRVER